MMRKVISLLLALLMLPLAGCSQEEPVQTEPSTESTSATEAVTEMPTEETELLDEKEVALRKRFSQYVTLDDTTPLEEALTVSYPLEELKAYFYPANWDVHWQNYAELPWVHDAFPIEIMRSNYYTVYRVEEGGYFYVFWDGYHNGYPYVRFSSYIPGDQTLHDLADIEIGVTTLEDLLQIDHRVTYSGDELCLWAYLNAEEVLRILYKAEYGYDEMGNFTHYGFYVTSIEVFPRDDCYSFGCRFFGDILPQDLP